MSAAPIEVDMVVRSDAPVKPGGDSVQIGEYEPFLRAAGVDVRQLPFTADLRFRPGAIVHVFNVDRPYEFVAAARRARGHRLVVSPIHHNADRVRAMRAADRGRGVVSASGRLLSEPVREWAATTVRSLRGARDARALAATVRLAAGSLPVVRGVWRAAGRELDRADAVALLARGEGRDLAALTGWSRANEVLVPNGRPDGLDALAGRAWSERPEGSILVVGRIEPRKRQLEVARAADRLGVPVTFVGPVVGDGTAYSREFTALAAASPAVRHRGAVERAAVLRMMGEARVLLNASWVEVQSLVDLEAAFMGCAVVASSAGHSREWLGEAVAEVRGDDPADLVAEAARVAALPNGPEERPSYDWTWERAAEALLAVYRR